MSGYKSCDFQITTRKKAVEIMSIKVLLEEQGFFFFALDFFFLQIKLFPLTSLGRDGVVVFNDDKYL